jgi:hypothetical protein
VESAQIKINKSYNSENAGLAVLKQELKDTNFLKILDKDCPKHSGFKSSDIFTLCVFKNIMNISTFTETSEIFQDLPELTLNLSRTTISRNLTNIGNIKNYNFYLAKFVEDLIKKYKINPKNLRTIVDETTIEVSQTSKTYQNSSWVWDNAQSKLVWGYEVTIVGIEFNDLFLPVHFELGKMSKEDLLTRFEIIRMFTGSTIVLFDGGFICDIFFKKLTLNNFIFYSKVGKKWKFEFGSKMNVKQIKINVNLLNKTKYQSYKLCRIENDRLTNIEYNLCFKKGDTRVLITNNLDNNISKLAFEEFLKRWDIETCNYELKDNFCFEKLPIRNEKGIIGHILSSLMALNLVSIIKIKFKKQLGKLFNKGFKKIIRWIICVKAKWYKYKQKIRVKFRKKFKFMWFFEDYI